MRWVLVLALAASLAIAWLAAPIRSAARATRRERPERVDLPVAVPVLAPEADRRAVSRPPGMRTHVRFRQTLKEIEAWPPDLPPKLVERTLRDALARTDAPLPRQQLIFLAPRLLPASRAKALLSALDDPADSENVILALAFNGDP